MKALFVAYQDSDSRRWAPVARLTREGGRYHFSYTRGAEDIPDFAPFGRLSDLNQEYVSQDLFPLFANRVLPKSRPEYADYLNWLGLSLSDHDTLEELGRTSGLRATDSLELIPCPAPTESGRYEVFFFSRGLRHLPENNQHRALKLKPGERLFLLKDIQNSVDQTALLMRTNDPMTLVGFAPRYYSEDFTDLIQRVGPEAVTVTVERINLNAPTQYRLLCKLSAPWPKGFAPCETDQYKPIIKTNAPNER